MKQKSNALASAPKEKWLSLKAASEKLGVHEATLRRWADQGDMPHMLTPGGHRRFALSEVDRFAHVRTVSPHAQALSVPEAWAQRAQTHTREDMPQLNQQNHALATMTDDTREKHRTVGRKLMALTLQYLTAEDGTPLLAEAKLVGEEYARVSLSSGIALADALQAALFFRDKLLEASLDLPETTRPRASDQSRLLKRVNALLNTVQLAMVDVYEQKI